MNLNKIVTKREAGLSQGSLIFEKCVKSVPTPRLTGAAGVHFTAQRLEACSSSQRTRCLGTRNYNFTIWKIPGEVECK